MTCAMAGEGPRGFKLPSCPTPPFTCTPTLSQPRTTALIFSTGKVVVTGARSISQVKTAMKKFRKKIQKVETTQVRLILPPAAAPPVKTP